MIPVINESVGYSFIYAGCGYGGSCFPKDVEALIKTSDSHGYKAEILQAVERVNRAQKLVIPNKIVKKFGENLNGRVFGIWGLSFKPDTDDMREAPAVTIIREIVKRGGKVRVYDPKAMEQARECYLADIENIEYCKSKYTTISDADAMILVTEWKEFRAPDFEEIKKRLKFPVFFDGRNQYYPSYLEEIGIEYYQIGVGGGH